MAQGIERNGVNVTCRYIRYTFAQKSELFVPFRLIFLHLYYFLLTKAEIDRFGLHSKFVIAKLVTALRQGVPKDKTTHYDCAVPFIYEVN